MMEPSRAEPGSQKSKPTFLYEMDIIFEPLQFKAVKTLRTEKWARSSVLDIYVEYDFKMHL